MADLTAYPANMTPQNALVVRNTEGPDHAVVPYTAEDLSRPKQGPANPFRDESNSLKRKNVLTGHAQETYLSEHTFRSGHRAVEGRGGPNSAFLSNTAAKAEAARIKAKRQRRGDATISEGDGAYVGPWAAYTEREYDVVGDGEELASDEEYEEVEEEEEEEVIESGTLVQAPPQALAQRKEEEAEGQETTKFHGSEEYDYQGRTYMHVPKDLDVDLEKEVGSIKNYIPKKLVHTWKGNSKPVSALRFFPKSGHLLLSAADTTVKLYDFYHQKELLRSYSGHTKALTDITFNPTGSQMISGSWDRMMKLWDVESGACIRRFTTGKTPHCLKFNPSGPNEFLAGISNKIVQFDIREKEPVVQEYDHHLADINTITFLDDDATFSTTSHDKSIRIWNWHIPVPIKYIAEPYMYPLVRADLHPSKKWVVYQSADNQIVVYGATDKFRQNRKKSFRGHNTAGYAIDVACSPQDGSMLASGDTGGYLCFWDFKTCKMWHKIQASDSAVTCVQWHPQETSKVVSAGLDGNIKVWD